MKNRIILVIFISLMLILAMHAVVNAVETNQSTQEENTTENELIYSDKYLVKGDSISRIEVKTSIEEFKKNIEVKEGNIVKIYKEGKEITSGYIGTGMIVKGERVQDYRVSVIGDITGDGILNQIELTKIIRHLIGLKDWKLEGVELASADINGDGKINLVDIGKIINYIVYGRWGNEGVEAPEAPSIEIISKKEENEDNYINEVKIKIKADKSEQIAKTTYKIVGSKNQEETEIKEGEIITITGEGEYVITAYTYGVEGNKSKGVNKTIKIKEPIPELTEGNMAVKYTTTEWTNGPVKVNIGTTEEGYKLQYSTDGKTWKDYTEEIEMEGNGTIYVRLENSKGKVGEVTEIAINNIDKDEPKVELGTNGGEYVIPAIGNGKINTVLSAADSEGSGVDTLQYSWSTSSAEEPTAWLEATNESKIEKTDITEAGTWYLWTKVTDKAGNVNIKISNAFKISTEEEVANQIILTADKTGWTNEDVTVKVTYGANLVAGKEISCTGTAGTDYIINGTESAVIKTNNQTVTVKAQDAAGNIVSKTLLVKNIDKVVPVLSTALSSPSKTSSNINLSIGVTDSVSGFSKIEWYYKLNTESTYKKVTPEADAVMNGSTEGVKTEVTKEAIISELISGKTYNIYAVVYNVAGNSTRSETINVTTTEIPAGSSNITFSYSTQNWTNQNVNVTIAKTSEAEGYTLQYSKDGSTWTNYTLPVEISENGEIYARLVDEVGNEGTIATGTIPNIDKVAPVISTAISSQGKTSSSINLSIGVTDSLSGFSKIEWYYKLSTASTYTSKTPEVDAVMNGNAEGARTEVPKETVLSDLKTGTYNIYAVVYDVAGNSTRSETINVTTESIPAGSSNITFSYSTQNWTNQNVNVTIAKTSEAEGYTLQYSKDGSTWTNYTSPVEISENGEIYARLVDSVGNEGTVATGKIQNIDKVAPVVSTALSSQSKTSSSINLSIGVTDSLSGFSKIEWYYKLSTASTYTSKTPEADAVMNGNAEGARTEVPKETVLSDLKTGTYNIYAVVYDVAGNSTRSETINVTTESIPAGSSNITFSYSNENWTNQNVNVTITKTSGAEGYTLQYSKDGSTWTNYTSPVEMSENGAIYARLVDSTGNEGTVATGNVTKIDKEAPTVNTNLSSLGATDTAISLGINVTDSLSGISKIDWYYKESTASTYESLTDEYTEMNGSMPGTQVAITKETVLSNLKIGTYNIYAIVYDVAGNSTRSPETGEISVTTEVPSGSSNITFSYSPANWTNGNVNVTITKSSGASSYTLQYFNNNNWINYTSPITVSSNGAIYAKLIDSVGNEGTVATGNVTKIDKEAPIVNTDLISSGATDTAISLSINVTDSLSGISKIEWYYKKSTASTYTSLTDEYTTMNGANAGTQEAGTKTISGLTASTTYNIYAVVYDVAGNSTRSPETGYITAVTTGPPKPDYRTCTGTLTRGAYHAGTLDSDLTYRCDYCGEWGTVCADYYDYYCSICETTFRKAVKVKPCSKCR